MWTLSVQFSLVAQSCPTLCDPKNRSMPASLSITNSQSSLRLTSIESGMPPAISSSVVPFFSCPQSLPASESFPMSQLFAWGGQSTGVSASASFLPKKSQGWSPIEWTGWISLQFIVKAMVFPVVMYGCESWTVKKAERRRIDAFELWTLWTLRIT